MFKKRIKKHYPEGTFIPTAPRVCAIIQLCIAFSCILFIFSEPFAGEVFNLKSALLSYQNVMGIKTDKIRSLDDIEQLKKNKIYFQSLPLDQQNKLINEMEAIQKQFDQTIGDKLASIIQIFTLNLTSYELAFILLSIIIPILLLKRVDGATKIVWLLPLLIACYALDNRLYGKPRGIETDLLLFPTEKHLVSNYIKEGLKTNIFDQQKQLSQALKDYLIENFANETPSSEPIIYLKQIEKGEFFFALARLEAQPKYLHPKLKTYTQEPLWLLSLYFFWNIFFAYTSWVYTHKSIEVSSN